MLGIDPHHRRAYFYVELVFNRIMFVLIRIS
jgi:hypothetical protein